MKYDMVIVGGGMVGATLAVALQAQHRVLLIDASPENKQDHRLIALSHPSVCLLKKLNTWGNLENVATPIHEVHVSKRRNLGITRISKDVLELDALGYVVPAKYINTALHDAIKVDIIRPGILKKFHQDADQVYFSVETDGELKDFTANYMVAADGSHSFVREDLHISTEKLDYEQSAIVTTTKLQRSHHNIAYERFLDEGAIAMLPLEDDKVATIWTVPNHLVNELLALDDETFLQRLQKNFGYRLGRLKEVSKRYSYPLHFIKANENQKDRIILIGNALHTMQPIAAQGLNIALHEITILMDYFSKPISGRINFSKSDIPTKLSHHLSSIFSTDFFCWNVVRQTSMMAFDLFPSLKKYFLQRVMYE